MQWLQDYTFPRESSMQDLEAAASQYQVACILSSRIRVMMRLAHTSSGCQSSGSCALHQKPGCDLQVACRLVADKPSCNPRCAQSLVGRLLRNGTTTALYFASLHLAPSLTLARVCSRAGQRAFVGKVGATLLNRACRAASVALGLHKLCGCAVGASRACSVAHAWLSVCLLCGSRLTGNRQCIHNQNSIQSAAARACCLQSAGTCGQVMTVVHACAERTSACRCAWTATRQTAMWRLRRMAFVTRRR